MVSMILTLLIAIFFAILLNPLSTLISLPIIVLTIVFPKLVLPTLFLIGATLGNQFQIFTFGLFLVYQAGVKKTKIAIPRDCMYFFCVLGTWLVIEFYQLTNLAHSLQFFKDHDIFQWSTYLKTEYHHLIQTVTIVSNLWLIIISYQFFKSYQLKDFKFGLILAVLLLQLLTTYQIFIDPFIFGNQTNFWLMQLRFSGTFTDPNAFALASFIIIGFLVFLSEEDRSDKKLPVIIFIQILLTSCSGSRTFFLALFGSLLGLSYLRSKKLFYTSIIICFSTLFFINLLFLANRFSPTSLSIFPTSIYRVLTSLNIEDVSQTFFSRQVFNELNFLIFKDYPIFGIGLNQFDQFLPSYQNLLHSDIGSWVDNNNNFYFGLLSELGLLGFLSFLCLINCFRFDFSKSKILIVFCLVFLSLLLLGPHFYFTEVSILFGFLVSQVVRENPSITQKCPRILSLAFCLVIILGCISNSRFRTIGLYPVEQDGVGNFHWSKQEAKIFLDCSKVQSLALEEFMPDVKIQSLQISEFGRVPLLGQKFVDLKLDGGKFICPDIQSQFQIYLKLSGVWQPINIIPSSNDQRYLGVKVRFNYFSPF